LKRDSAFFGGAIGSSNGFVICLNLLETIRRRDRRSGGG
jgi:hypothetical protein